MLPALSDAIAAPSDLPTEESSFPAGAPVEVSPLGAPNELTISVSLLRVCLFADARAFLLFLVSFAGFFKPPAALGPPDVSGISVYCWHAEHPFGDFAADATAGTTSAAARKQAVIPLRENKTNCSLSRPRPDTK